MVGASLVNHASGVLKTSTDDVFGKDNSKKSEIGRLGPGIKDECVEGTFSVSSRAAWTSKFLSLEGNFLSRAIQRLGLKGGSSFDKSWT